MMACGQAERLLSAYADQELTGQQMLAVREHISRCPECARELEAVRGVRQALGELPTVDPDPGLEGRLQAAVFGGSSAMVRPVRLKPAHGLAALSLGAVAAAWAVFAFQAQPERVSAQDVEAFRATVDSTYVVGSDPFGSHVAVHPAGYPDR
jgi:anti-sigma factor RsiW